MHTKQVMGNLQGGSRANEVTAVPSKARITRRSFIGQTTLVGAWALSHQWLCLRCSEQGKAGYGRGRYGRVGLPLNRNPHPTDWFQNVVPFILGIVLGLVAATPALAEYGAGLYGRGIYGISPSCEYVITPPSRAHTPSAQSGTINIAAAPDCAWTATSHSSWIQILPPDNGMGNGEITYAITQNRDGQSRTGSLSINETTVPIQQAPELRAQIQWLDGELLISWQTFPFPVTVETTTNLAQPVWTVLVDATSASSIVITGEERQLFFRLVYQPAASGGTQP